MKCWHVAYYQCSTPTPHKNNIYTYIKRERHRERDRERQRDRKRETERARWICKCVDVVELISFGRRICITFATHMQVIHSTTVKFIVTVGGIVVLPRSRFGPYGLSLDLPTRVPLMICCCISASQIINQSTNQWFILGKF
jgi:hypothetical protein